MKRRVVPITTDKKIEELEKLLNDMSFSDAELDKFIQKETARFLNQ